jgi:hypothetical protein
MRLKKRHLWSPILGLNAIKLSLKPYMSGGLSDSVST